ncbi:MAG: class I SAM-dependent methyltransferase [Chloroflexota bacterium]
MQIKPHSAEWYARLSKNQEGYFFPWKSQLCAGNAYDAYPEIVHQHLAPDLDVLDVACAQGVISNRIAPHCRSVLGYDISAPWIERANADAEAQGLTNVTFICHDSSRDANGEPRIPAEDDSFDLLICSKGPFHWMEDARRVARPGATLLMLVPDGVPDTPWRELLPEPLNWRLGDDPNWARPAITNRLAIGNLTLHSWWSYDVPEVFLDAEQLYVRLAWGYIPEEVPSFDEVQPLLECIFDEYTEYVSMDVCGIVLRHRRYIWKAIVPPK